MTDAPRRTRRGHADRPEAPRNAGLPADEGIARLRCGAAGADQPRRQARLSDPRRHSDHAARGGEAPGDRIRTSPTASSRSASPCDRTPPARGRASPYRRGAAPPCGPQARWRPGPAFSGCDRRPPRSRGRCPPRRSEGAKIRSRRRSGSDGSASCRRSRNRGPARTRRESLARPPGRYRPRRECRGRWLARRRARIISHGSIGGPAGCEARAGFLREIVGAHHADMSGAYPHRAPRPRWPGCRGSPAASRSSPRPACARAPACGAGACRPPPALRASKPWEPGWRRGRAGRRREVVLAPGRVEGVDADHDLAGAVAALSNGRADLLAGRRLGVGRDRVLEIEDQRIGGQRPAPSRARGGWSRACRGRCGAG